MREGILLGMIGVLFPIFMSAQDIAGTWRGNINANGATLTVVFDITETGDGYSATMDSPNQGAYGIPLTSVSLSGDKLVIKSSELGMDYEGVVAGDQVLGSMTQMGHTLMLNLKKGKPELRRPQEPKPPYPYITEDITFANPEAGINLAGTLSYPSDGKALAAVVFITGSGPQDRNEEIFGHKPFLVIADYLARRGIASLRFDDRGVALSEGVFAEATSRDLATDALAALKYVRERGITDSSKIGLLGHSEGGLIAFILAGGKDREEVDFVVSMAGPGVRGDILMKEQRRLILTAQGLPEEFIDMNEGFIGKISSLVERYGAEEVYDNAEKYAEQVFPQEMFSGEMQRKNLTASVVQMTSPWMQFFMKYDPADVMKNIKCPVLAINGDKDLQVSATQNLPAIEHNIRGNVTTIKYEGLNHLFQHAVSGLSAEYGSIEETIAPEVLEDIAGWIIKITE